MKRREKKRWLVAGLTAILLISTGLLATAWKRYGHSAPEREPAEIFLENREQIVEALRGGLTRHARQISIAFDADSDAMGQISEIADALMEEALEETDVPTEGDYIRFQYGGYEVHYSRREEEEGYRYDVRILPDYYTYPVQEEEVTEEVRRILASFHFCAQTPDSEKVRKIYEYVYQNVSYDEVHAKKKTQHMKATAYSALKYRTAVCQGYSVLMYRLLREAGISARVITGIGVRDGVEEYHAWNLVGIGGVYYNLDVTWDKALGTEEYYMKPGEEFPDHVRDGKYQTEQFYERYPMA